MLLHMWQQRICFMPPERPDLQQEQMREAENLLKVLGRTCWLPSFGSG